MLSLKKFVDRGQGQATFIAAARQVLGAAHRHLRGLFWRRLGLRCRLLCAGSRLRAACCLVRRCALACKQLICMHSTQTMPSLQVCMAQGRQGVGDR